MGSLLNVIAQGTNPFQGQVERAQAQQAQQQTQTNLAHQELLRQQAAGAGLANQQKQLELQDEQVQRQAMQESDGDPEQFIRLLNKHGARPATVFQAQQNLFATRQNALKLSGEQRADLEARHEQYRGILEGVLAAPPERKQAAWDDARQRGAAIDPQDVQGLPEQYPGDEFVTMHHNALGMAGSILKEANEKLKGQETKAQAEKATAEAKLAMEKIPGEQIGAQTKQREADASVLAAAARQSPEALQAALDELPHGRAKVFAGQTKPEEILKLGMTPEQVTTTTQTRAHQLEEEKAARDRIRIEQQKANIEAQKFAAEYGGDAVKGWSKSIQMNPDAAGSVPAHLRTGIEQQFMKDTGLPFPKPLATDALTQERAARTAMEALKQINQDMQDPEIQSRIGPILGRLGNAEQAVGSAVGLSPQAEAKAQRLRTNMRYLVFQEGKALLGGRMPQNLMKELESSSPSVKMDASTLQGAMSGVQDAALRALDSADQQRFGGKMRSREDRGIVPVQIGGGAKAAPKAGTIDNGYKFKGGDPSKKENWEKQK